MIFEITFENGNKGYITFVDTAGRENPVDIYNLFIDTEKSKKSRINLTTVLGPTGNSNIIQNNLKDIYKEYNPDNILEILNEGIYINETLNHLIYYFNNKNYVHNKILMQGSLEKYSINNYYINPLDEENSISDQNNCLMIPILKFLDNLSNKNKSDFKPTKFICMVCIRPEEEYCSQIISSLEFAQNISSS